MPTKKEKVDDINTIIDRSPFAKSKGAKAELVNGKIEYSKLRTSGTGEYREKANFFEISMLLDGKDIRLLKAKYGHNKSG